MNDSELRTRLRAILDLEAATPVDWERVEFLSHELSQNISQASGYEPPHLIHHYLDDADIREKDDEYAESQRADIRRFGNRQSRTIGKQGHFSLVMLASSRTSDRTC